MPDTEALESLHTALLDSRKGYDEAVSDEKSPEIKGLFKKVQALHAEAHVDVHRMLKGRGVEPDETGSLMAKLHETVISVRAAVAGLGTGSLGSFASGEGHNVSKYDAAIEEVRADPDAVTSLQRHRANLAAAIESMKVLAT